MFKNFVATTVYLKFASMEHNKKKKPQKNLKMDSFIKMQFFHKDEKWKHMYLLPHKKGFFKSSLLNRIS